MEFRGVLFRSHDVAAAARLGARIPRRPPVHAEERGDGDDRERPGVAAVRPEGEDVGGAAAGRAGGRAGGMRAAEGFRQRARAADGAPRDDGEDDRAAHLEAVLQAVRRCDAPVAGEDGVGEGDAEGDGEGAPLRDAEGAGEDLGHAEVHPPHDDDVDDERQVRGAEAARERRRLSGIPHLRQLDVGDDFGAPPQPREEEDGEHARGEHRPPQPVARDAVFHDHLGDGQRRVGGERRRHHGRAGEPPRHRAMRDEVVEHRPLRLADEGGGDADGEDEVAGDDEEVDESQVHQRRSIPSPLLANPGIVTGSFPVTGASPKIACTAATCTTGWMPYAQRYVPTEGISRRRYGVPNEIATTGLRICATSLRAASGTAICPAPERARTASATTTTSAFSTSARICGSSCSCVRASTTVTGGGDASAWCSSQASSGSGFTVSGNSLTTTRLTFASFFSGSAPGYSRTSVMARRAMSAATSRCACASTVSKISDGGATALSTNDFAARIRCTEASMRASLSPPLFPAAFTAAIAASTSGDIRIWSSPASIARTAASPASKCSVRPPMSNASVTMRPRKPSSPRSNPSSIRFEIVAGSVPFCVTSAALVPYGFCATPPRTGADGGSSAGTERCPAMIEATPAAMAAPIGASSTRSRRSRETSRIGRARGGSMCVSPCPGKCFAQARTCSDCTPRRNATAKRLTSCGSSPKLRVLMTGLSGSMLTSTTGA